MPSLVDRAGEVLRAASLEEKCRLSAEVVAQWRAGTLAPRSSSGPARVPETPARPEGRPPASAEDVSSLVKFVHGIAHAESWAIDLSWDIIARFGHHDLPRAFYDDWVKVAEEEVKHYRGWLRVLEGLGTTYGALPGHDTLWATAQATADSLAARLVMVHVIHEGRGLDTYPVSRRKVEHVPGCAAMLDRNYGEEITHVAAGVRWFKYLCGREGADPRERFAAVVRTHFRGRLPRNPPFNHEARAACGMPREWYVPLAAPIDERRNALAFEKGWPDRRLWYHTHAGGW